MGFVPANGFVLIQLSVLLLSCFTVYGGVLDILSWAESPHHHAPSYSPAEAPKHPRGHHHHHHKGHSPAHPPTPSPSHAPVHTPMHPPSKPPKHAPVHPPMYSPGHSPSHPPSYHLPPRSLVAVQGVVYCKSCKYTGIDTLLGASPLLGAVVRLQCNNTKYPLVEEGKTDKNGYFFIMAPKKVTTYGSHKCKVFIVSSPLATCNKPTDLHAGSKGAILMPQKSSAPPPHPFPFVLFSVGPFAFEPSGKASCQP
ncbi:hypothetical protein F0562_018530 [Nyssa sinensis]|uniref:Pistil-specific extensin-like protein n=1 Tax=Nyssa sinensis TaxID=561372 RepID=A0A5J4Z9Y9_9ASTE|nr:hypothetical protein F0562_018530 [Nyssa sinensis]